MANTFLTLVPHRDVRLLLRTWSASLFAAGLPGAWSFPWVAPLAALSRPLHGEELKRLAHNLRECANLHGGPFKAGPPDIAAFSIGASNVTTDVFGPALGIELSDDFFEPCGDAVLCRLLPPVIGTALLQTAAKNNGSLPASASSPPEISFRAAALANMHFRPLSPDGYSFEWKIGALHWLPKSQTV